MREPSQSQSTPTVSVRPEIEYSNEALDQIGLLTSVVEEGVEIGVRLGDEHGAPIDRVCVYKFTSVEDPSYSEIVIAFYSAADRERLIELFPVIAQGVGEWAHEMRDEEKLAVTSLISVRVRPLAFWSHVRS